VSTEPTRGATKKQARPKRSLRFTRQGRFYVLVTLGVGAAALNTGNNLLYLVLGLLLSLVILSGVLSDLVLFSIVPSRSLPARAHAKSPFLVELTLTNHKRWLPSFSIEVEDVAAGVPTERLCYFLRVEPEGERRAVYRRRTEERGLLRFEQLVLRTSYPFGLFEKSLRYVAPAELVVYPELEPDRLGLRSAEARSDGESEQRAGLGTEPLGVREYRTGDEARSVHARRSASLGTLVVKETARARSPRIRIPLADVVPYERVVTSSEGEPWRAGFETAIRRAAWIAVEAHGKGADVEVRGASGRSARAAASASLDPLLRFLALIEPRSSDEQRSDARGAEPTAPRPLSGPSARSEAGSPTGDRR
jgi:uncharacterized protein (DUF58 family)